MNLSITVNVHCIKKVSYLLQIFEVRRKEFFDVFKSHEPIVVTVNLEKHFPESFCVFFTNFTAISNNVLDALPEKQTFSVTFHAI